MTRYMGLTRLAVVAMALIVLVAMAPALAVGGEGESWPSFNESPGCGSLWAIGPNAEAMGPLDRDTILRGPQAAYFGRTVGQVADSLVPWAVPMSDGEVLQVHLRTLPALQQVAVSLRQATTRGWAYDITSTQTFGYNSRTVGGKYRISQHSFGNAVDVNSWSNPSTRGPLVTDMPAWFVRAWTDAGFCWGGDWVDQSDAMHFSWRGPSFGSRARHLPKIYPPLTDVDDFSSVTFQADVPRPVTADRFEILMDADGDSAIDVVSLAHRGESLVVEVASARSGYVECATATFDVLGRIKGSTAIPGDWDGDGISDIWLIDDTDGIVVSPLLRTTGFSPGPSVRLDVQEGDRYLAADFDVDGWSDLYILRHTGQGWNLEIRSGQDRLSSILATAFFSGDATSRFTAIDRDLDQVPDLVALGPSSILVLDGASGFVTVEPSSLDVTGASDIAGTDFDGDGRHDLAVLVDGELTIHAGNTPLDGTDPTSWFLSPPDFMCDVESTSNAR
jgi:hypothetical protein